MPRNKVIPPPPPCPFCDHDVVPNGTICPECKTSIPKACRRDHRSVGVLEIPVTWANIDADYNGRKNPDDDDDDDDETPKRKGKKR